MRAAPALALPRTVSRPDAVVLVAPDAADVARRARPKLRRRLQGWWGYGGGWRGTRRAALSAGEDAVHVEAQLGADLVRVRVRVRV